MFYKGEITCTEDVREFRKSKVGVLVPKGGGERGRGVRVGCNLAPNLSS